MSPMMSGMSGRLACDAAKAKPAGTTSAHNYIVLGDDSVTATNAILFFYALGSSNAFRFVSSSSRYIAFRRCKIRSVRAIAA